MLKTKLLLRPLRGPALSWFRLILSSRAAITWSWLERPSTSLRPEASSFSIYYSTFIVVISRSDTFSIAMYL